MATTNKDKEKILLLRAQGYSIKKISQETGVCKDAVSNVLGANREEVEALVSIEMDALLKEQALSKEGRIASFAAVLKQIRDELSNRSLADVPTDQLFKMFLATQKELRAELDGVEVLSPDDAEHEKKVREYKRNWDFMG